MKIRAEDVRVGDRLVGPRRHKLVIPSVVIGETVPSRYAAGNVTLTVRCDGGDEWRPEFGRHYVLDVERDV